MMHLTREGVRRLLDGTAPPAEARAIAAHLHEDCPACDELLASSEAPALEAQVDRALTSLAPPRPDEAGNDLEFARIQRSLRSARGSTASGWRRAAAVAAAVVVVAGVG